MKDIRIDGKLARVFVLKESEDSLVYIPVKSLFRVDYEQLKKMEEQGGELLKTMSKTNLENNRNALVQYDSLIQVLRYTSEDKKKGHRLKKPTERIRDFEMEQMTGMKQGHSEVIEETVGSSDSTQTGEGDNQTQAQPQKQRRKPGPKPGSKRNTNKTQQ